MQSEKVLVTANPKLEKAQLVSPLHASVRALCDAHHQRIIGSQSSLNDPKPNAGAWNPGIFTESIPASAPAYQVSYTQGGLKEVGWLPMLADKDDIASSA